MATKEEDIQVQAADGTADAVLVRDAGGRRLPGVLLLTDIGGIRDSYRKMARRIAGAGYTVLLPNVFYRSGRPPLWAWPRNMAEERSQRRFAELTAPLSPAAQEQDAAAYVDFVASQPQVRDGAMGVVGHCFTGGMALRTAAVRPERIAAAASFHGGGLWSEAPTSPHLLLPRIQARLYFGHAVEDSSMPAAAVEHLESALAAWGGRYESETYEGAHHGWTSEDSPVYDAPQAERAFAKLAELLAATL
jgi:carboxymethylenebutenolidase